MYKEIKWKCPHCNTPNIDVYQLTCFPFCEYCDRLVDWYEILAQDYQYIVYVTEHLLYKKWDFQADPLDNTGLLYLSQDDIPVVSIQKLTTQATLIGLRSLFNSKLLYIYVLEK